MTEKIIKSDLPPDVLKVINPNLSAREAIDQMMAQPFPETDFVFEKPNPGISIQEAEEYFVLGAAMYTLALGNVLKSDTMMTRREFMIFILSATATIAGLQGTETVKKLSQKFAGFDRQTASNVLTDPIDLLFGQFYEKVTAQKKNAALIDKNGIRVNPFLDGENSLLTHLIIEAGSEQIGNGLFLLMPENFVPVIRASHQVSPSALALYSAEAAHKLGSAVTNEMYVSQAGWNTNMLAAYAQGLFLPSNMQKLDAESQRRLCIWFTGNPGVGKNKWLEEYGIRTVIFSSDNPVYNELMMRIGMTHKESPWWLSYRSFCVYKYDDSNRCTVEVMNLDKFLNFLKKPDTRRWTAWEPTMVLDERLVNSTKEEELNLVRSYKPVSFIVHMKDKEGNLRLGHLQMSYDIWAPPKNSFNICRKLAAERGFEIMFICSGDAGGSLGITRSFQNRVETYYPEPMNQMAENISKTHTTGQHAVFIEMDNLRQILG